MCRLARLLRGHVVAGSLLVLFASCGDGGTAGYVPGFTPAACPGESTDPTVTCGFVTVPESRASPAGPKIRLAVARLAALEADPGAAPLIYLHGGPGGHVLQSLDAFARSPLRAERELILLDQRGVGLSEPALDCPEREEATWENFARTGDRRAEILSTRAATAACRDRLRAAGVRLESYDTVENAHDVDDVRRALGIAEWNLYGVSYGTTLALQTMRSHPEAIRAVVLDATYPLHLGLDVARGAETADRVLAALAESCEQNATCSAAVDGDLVGYLYATVAEFDADPYVVETTDEEGRPRRLRIDGSDVFAGVFNALYDDDLIAIFATILQQVRARNPIFLDAAARSGILFVNDLYEGAFLAAECRDRGRGQSLDRVEALLRARPELTSLYQVFAVVVCDLLDLGSIDSSLNRPVQSDIPTLVFAGEFDPVTPPAWGADTAAHLRNSSFFELPGLGHGSVDADPCPRAMMAAFLAEPSVPVDDACIDEMRRPF